MCLKNLIIFAEPVEGFPAARDSAFFGQNIIFEELSQFFSLWLFFTWLISLCIYFYQFVLCF